LSCSASPAMHKAAEQTAGMRARDALLLLLQYCFLDECMNTHSTHECTFTRCTDTRTSYVINHKTLQAQGTEFNARVQLGLQHRWTGQSPSTVFKNRPGKHTPWPTTGVFHSNQGQCMAGNHIFASILLYDSV
jgi:hypothetical protein